MPIEEASANLDVLDRRPRRGDRDSLRGDRSMYVSMQSYTALFNKSRHIGSVAVIVETSFEEDYIRYVRKEFDKYFRVMHNFLEVVVGGKIVTLETEPESATLSRLNLKHTEFLYPVGCNSVRMFRVAEENSKNIYTIKIASLIMSDPLTYQPFLACVKEALLLNKKLDPNHDLLTLRGYFLVTRRTYRVWDIQIDLILMLEDHDLTLMDLIRARKLNKMPWPKDYAETLTKKLASMIAEYEKTYEFRFLYFNPLNVVYSKASQKFMIANLNNVFLNVELDKIKEIQKGGIRFNYTPSSFFTKVFPDLARLYSSSDHQSLEDQTSQYSLSILGLQLAEVCLQKEESGQEIANILEDKMQGKLDTNSLRASKALNKNLGGFGSRLIDSMSANTLNALLDKGDPKNQQALEAKVESEIKAVNAWKDLIRSLIPDYNHIKHLHEANLFLVAGNAKKAISSGKKAIEEFTKVKDLNVTDWIDLVSFLVNSFMRVNIQDQAKFHATNLIHYIDKAAKLDKVPKMLAKMDKLCLRSIIEDPIEILEERDSWELSKPFEHSLSFHLYYLGLDSPDRLLKFLTHSGSEDSYIARSFNFEILYKLYLGNLDGLKLRLKTYFFAYKGLPTSLIRAL